jgi:hypothetical protein
VNNITLSVSESAVHISFLPVVTDFAVSSQSKMVSTCLISGKFCKPHFTQVLINKLNLFAQQQTAAEIPKPDTDINLTVKSNSL